MYNSNEFILKQRREFGDVIGDALKFMKINLQPMLSVFLTYVIPTFLLPLLIILALGFLPVFLGAFSLDPGEVVDPSIIMGSMMGIFLGMAIFMIFMLIGYMLMNLIVFGTFLAYEENGNEKVTADQIKAKIKEKFVNYLVSILILIPLMLALYFVFIFIVGISAFLGMIAVFLAFLLAMPAFIWFAVNIVNFSWIRVREDIGVGEGFSRAFGLNKGSWWSMCGVVIVSGIISAIASYAFSVPFHIFSSFAGISGFGGTESTTIMVIIAGLGFLVYMVGSAYVQQYSTVCTIMKYYDQIEKKDGSSLAAQIDELGDEPDSFFENEGEY